LSRGDPIEARRTALHIDLPRGLYRRAVDRRPRSQGPQIFKQTGAGRLVLITCGDFDGDSLAATSFIAEPAS
jgi:hypothetical protein